MSRAGQEVEILKKKTVPSIVKTERSCWLAGLSQFFGLLGTKSLGLY